MVRSSVPHAMKQTRQVCRIIADKKEHVWNGKPILNDYDAAVSWMHASAPDIGGAIPREDKKK